MTIRGLQLNAQEFFEWNNLKQYLSDNDFDVITLQEVWHGRYSLYDDEWFDAIKYLESLWYTVIYGCAIDLDDNSWDRGNLIASKFPVIDSKTYYNHPSWSLPKQSNTDLWIDLDVSIYKNRVRKRSLERKVPFGFTVVDIEIASSPLRLVTMHYRAWPACTETIDMKECTTFVLNTLKNLKEKPIIISWDFNIHKKSESIQSFIQYWYNHVNSIHHTTLNPRTHPWFKNDIPLEWLMVDHVFMKWLQLIEYSIPMVTVSDHLPIEYICKI